MAKTLFFKVTSLPAELEPNSFYYVENGDYADAYLTDISGQPSGIGNTTMINSVITSRIGEVQNIDVVADLVERDALTPVSSEFVIAVDAAADPQVTSGAALYVYDTQLSQWQFLTEYSNVSALVDWANVLNKPTSSTAAIDQAVTDSHTHANAVQLDKISETGGGLIKYNGVVVFDPASRLGSTTAVNSLPGTLAANTVYYVTSGGKFDLYLSDDTGSTVSPLNIPESSGGGGSVTDKISEYDANDFYVGYNLDGNWEIKKYDGTDVNLKTKATQSNNVIYNNLTDAWTNKLTLTYA